MRPLLIIHQGCWMFLLPREGAGVRRVRRQAELQGEKCLTAHSDFKDNVLSESVLKIDVCQFLEEIYPLDDEDSERMHKLYRLVAYRRCSRWVFQILGKKNR